MGYKLLTLLRKNGANLLPYSLDFSTLPNGALPFPLVGSTWAISSGAAVNTPTLGSELLTDPGLEAWTSATNLTNWTETIAGTSTVNQEQTEIHGGSNAARLNIDASASVAVINQSPAGLSVGDWAQASAWAYSNPTGSALLFSKNNQLPQTVSVAIGATYAQYFSSFIYKTATSWIIYYGSNTGANASDVIYMDDLSLKKITKTTLYATIPATRADVTVKAGWTIPVEGVLAGVIMNIDSISTPLNYVVLLYSKTVGGNGVQLYKVVNGTPSQVMALTAAAYVAGADVELRKSGTTYKCYYNGSQVGADQTISDAGIINNTIHGLISTYGGNSADSFFVG